MRNEIRLGLTKTDLPKEIRNIAGHYRQRNNFIGLLTKECITVSEMSFHCIK